MQLKGVNLWSHQEDGMWCCELLMEEETAVELMVLAVEMTG
jgi:hypothetical protein